MSLKGFYARRILRIFPALYSYILVISILSLAGVIGTTGGDIFRASAFLTNYGYLLHPHTNGDYWFVGHFWTLSLEEQFYLLWPLGMMMLGLRRSRYIALTIIVLSPPIRTVSYFLCPATRPYLAMMLHCASDAIMMGCFVALLAGHPNVEALISNRRSALWAASAAIFAIIPSAWLAIRFRGAYSITIGTTLNAGAVGYLLVYITRYPRSRSVRILEMKALRTIGLLSYSLYLWQQLFLGETRWRWNTFPTNLIACFATAVASSVIIERPFLKLRSRFSSRCGVAERKEARVELPAAGTEFRPPHAG
jgi:peptidoglycan/LPS O-acetylase OafA/YrhL